MAPLAELEREIVISPEVYQQRAFQGKTMEEFKKKLSTAALLKVIPKHCREKPLLKSLYYGIKDVTIVIALLYAFKAIESMELPYLVEKIVYVAYSIASGFFLWAIWCLGHDCGHSTFCESVALNDFFGHIFHGCLIVPYWPWQRSHRIHHTYHNDKKRDMSHPWFTPGSRADKGFGIIPKVLIILIGWPLYLLGRPDGSHFFPVGKLYSKASMEAKIKCIISATVCLLWMGFYYTYFGGAANAMYYIGFPILISGYYLNIVTYLQHHGDDTTVFHKDHFDFTLAAFETTDRSYGWPFDHWHHNITDGHVVHHLLATKIPHYHLLEATEALKAYMKKEGFFQMYRYKKTHDWWYKFVLDMLRKGYNFKHYVKTQDTQASEASADVKKETSL